MYFATIRSEFDSDKYPLLFHLSFLIQEVFPLTILFRRVPLILAFLGRALLFFLQNISTPYGIYSAILLNNNICVL